MFYSENYENPNFPNGSLNLENHKLRQQFDDNDGSRTMVSTSTTINNRNFEDHDVEDDEDDIQRQQAVTMIDQSSMFQSSMIFVDDNVNDDHGVHNRTSSNQQESKLSSPLSSSSGHQINDKKRNKKRMSLVERKQQKLEKLKSGHQVRPPCSCRMQCVEKISESRRQSINRQYWEMAEIDRNTFVLYSSERMIGSTSSTSMADDDNNCPSQENPKVKKANSFKYFLKNENDVRFRVCKRFFLTTLGYKSTNDSVLYTVLARKTPKGQLRPTPSERGKKSTPVNKFGHSDLVYSHIDSFNPTMPKYRKKHAPNVAGYLPSTLNAYGMFRDFQKKYPEIKLSSTLYSRHLKDMKISFSSKREYTTGPSYKDYQEEMDDNNELNQSVDPLEMSPSPQKQSSKKVSKKGSKKDERLKKSSTEHPLIGPCSCRSRCLQKIPESRRESIHGQFWSMQENDRNAYILYSCDRIMGDKGQDDGWTGDSRKKSKKDGAAGMIKLEKMDDEEVVEEELIKRKDNLYRYYFRDANDFRHRVCKQFFLTTLGYQPRNDTVLNTVLAKTPKGQLRPNPSMRGKSSARSNSEYPDLIQTHIQSFEPRLPDYLRRKAPNIRGYLPRQMTVRSLYKDFKEKHMMKSGKISYDTYRRHFKSFKYSFMPLSTKERNEARSRGVLTYDRRTQTNCGTETIVPPTTPTTTSITEISAVELNPILSDSI